jgi:hypothetical protein
MSLLRAPQMLLDVLCLMPLCIFLSLSETLSPLDHWENHYSSIKLLNHTILSEALPALLPAWRHLSNQLPPLPLVNPVYNSVTTPKLSH